MPNFTKDAIKRTFIDLLNQKPYNQITVKMIVETCGINRNSFYYHYQDLPAVIEEITQENVERVMNKYPTIDSAEMALTAIVDFTFENRRAILHVYNSVNRDIYERYLWQVCDHIVNAYAETLRQTYHIAAEDRRIISHFYKCECFGLAIDWLNRRMEPDVHREIKRLCELHHGLIEEMIRRSDEG